MAEMTYSMPSLITCVTLAYSSGDLRINRREMPARGQRRLPSPTPTEEMHALSGLNHLGEAA